MTPTIIRGALVYQGGMAVDADGSPRAYAPRSSGLPAIDDLGNAGHPGSWWGLVTDTGNASGTPLIQGANDPFPGGYISQTAMRDRAKSRRDPTSYVDAAAVPYVSIAGDLLHRPMELGDVAMVLWQGWRAGAICAEVGPHGKYGEGSIYLADLLNMPGRGQCHGRGLSRGVTWILFPGSAELPNWPREVIEFQAAAEQLFQAWGGEAAAAALSAA